jgi:hypothetical protein
MKVQFFYYWLRGQELSGNDYYMLSAALLIDAPEAITNSFNKYLLSALDTDFNQNREGQADEVLADIEKLERGEIDHCMAGTVDTLMHTITRDQVTFEHSIFGECPDWPLWSCTLAQYKAALQGWRKFIEMPKSIDTQLIIELPDDTL